MNALFRLTIRQMVGGKKIWILAIFLCLPILLLGAVLMAGGFSGGDNDSAREMAFTIFLYVLYPQILCILACLIYGASLLAGEMEDKTLVYLFSRAQSRWKILVGKYLATATVLGGMIAISMSICFVLAGAPVGMDLYCALLATVFAACFAYTALFALLGIALPQRAMTAGLIYAVVVEFILSLVPALVNQITVSYYLRSMAFHIADVPDLPQAIVTMISTDSATHAIGALILIPLAALFMSSVAIHNREWPLTEGV